MIDINKVNDFKLALLELKIRDLQEANSQSFIKGYGQGYKQGYNVGYDQALELLRKGELE